MVHLSFSVALGKLHKSLDVTLLLHFGMENAKKCISSYFIVLVICNPLLLWIFIGPESDHCLLLSLTHWLTDSLLFSKLDWCDPGVWRCLLKTCWGCYCCWCWGLKTCWCRFGSWRAQSLNKSLTSTKLRLPNLHQTVVNTFLGTNSNNLNKYWVGIFTHQRLINQGF